MILRGLEDSRDVKFKTFIDFLLLLSFIYFFVTRTLLIQCPTCNLEFIFTYEYTFHFNSDYNKTKFYIEKVTIIIKKSNTEVFPLSHRCLIQPFSRDL